MWFAKSFFIFLTVQLSSLIFCASVLAVSPGTYDYKNQTAHIVEKSSRDKYTIIYVNFIEKKVVKIASGNSLGDVAASSGRDVISYLDRGTIRIISAIENESIMNINIKSYARPKWSTEASYFSYHDMLSEFIIEVDFNNKNITKVPFKGRLLHSKWNKSCNCFLYQVTGKKLRSTEGHLDGKIMRNIDGQLQEYSDIKTLTMSPDDQYYYEGKVYPEMGNSVSFYANAGDKLIATFNAATSLANVDVLWGKDTVRFLYEGGVFDLKTGKLLTFSHNFWPEEGPRPKKLNPRRDVAADWKNYVLMWNKEKNVFEVEDINTGKIIKTYEKFW